MKWALSAMALTTIFQDQLQQRLQTIHQMKGSSYWAELRTTIWNKLTTLNDEERACGYHTINEYLTDEELAELKVCFNSLLIPIIELLTWDYEKYDQDLLGTIAYNAGTLLMNHYPEVVTAWLRSYDSFYANDTSPVTMNSISRTAPSEAAVVVTNEDGTQITYNSSDEAIVVFPTETISLVPSAATVMGAPKTTSPTASINPGTYEGKQEIMLTADEDADIYYSLVSFDAGTYTEQINAETAVYDENGNQVYNDDGTPVTETVVSYRDTYFPENYDDFKFSKMDSHVTVDQIGKDNYIIAYASKKGYSNSDYVILKYTLTPNQEYNLTVEGGSGSGRYLSGTKVTIAPEYPEKDTILEKWISDNDSIKLNDNDIEVSFPMPVGDTTITAKYARGHYVTLNTGIEDIPNQILKVYSVLSDDGKTYVDPAIDEIEAPTRDDAEFMGWYVNESKSIKYDFTKPVTENITLYARWSDDSFDHRDTYWLSLGNSVDIKIQIDVRGYLGDDLGGNEKMVITHIDPTKQSPTFVRDEILLKDAKLTDGLFITEITPAIAQIAEPVKVELYDNEGKPVTVSNGTTSFNFSAEGYCRAIIDNADKYDDETVNLASSIVNYGKAAYDYFTQTSHTPNSFNP